LMLRRKIKKPILFVFPRSSRLGSAIHSFFVFTPFDAVFLDERKRIIDVRSDVKPFIPLIVPRAAAKYLIEGPAGWAKKRRLKLGGEDRIRRAIDSLLTF